MTEAHRRLARQPVGTAIATVRAGGGALCGTLLLCAVLTVGVPGAGADPAISATPSSSLVDGDFVDVSVTGFSAVAPVLIWECGTDVSPCRVLSYGDADASGARTVRVRVFTIVEEGGVTVDCRTVSTCTIGALDIRNDTVVVHAPVGFDADSPLAPPQSLTITPDRDVRVGEPITLAGSGYNPDAGLRVQECFVQPGGGYCDREHVFATLHTDSQGAFRVTMPYEPVPGSDVVFRPSEHPACPPDNDCVYLTVPLEIDESGPVAALGVLPFTTSTTTTAPTTTAQPPGAAAPPARPVVAAAPFTG